MGLISCLPFFAAGASSLDFSARGPRPGDLMLFFATVQSVTVDDAPSAGEPSGWTRLLVSNPSASDSRGSFALYRKTYRAGDSVSAIGPVTWVSGGFRASYGLILYSNAGVDGDAVTLGNPPASGVSDAACVRRETAGSTDLIFPGWTVGASGDLLIGFGCRDTMPVIPVGWKGVANNPSTNEHALAWKPNGESSESTLWPQSASEIGYGVSIVASDGASSNKAWGRKVEVYGVTYPWLATGDDRPGAAVGGGIGIFVGG